MLKSNQQQHITTAPIRPTPRAKHGVKLHGYKLEYYADPAKGDDLMLSWSKRDGIDVALAHCANEDEFIEVMRALYARLATEAHKRAAESAE